MLLLKLKKILHDGLLRSPKLRTHLIDLTSNDYLGLARSELLQEKTISLWRQWSQKIPQKTGATGSRLLTGHHFFFQETEEEIAHFHESPTATLFNCGYMANLALLSALCSEKDTVILDLQSHASFHDGKKLCRAKIVYFRHNDLGHLEDRLKNQRKGSYVIIESLYSMSGCPAPLKEIGTLCQKYQAHLIVDEAHAVGILGPQGKGLVVKAGLQKQVFARIVTFGKALGVQGAAILGSSLLQKILFNCARPFIYTTALSLPLLAAIAASYSLFPAMDKERQNIQILSKSLGIFSHIYPLIVPGNFSVKLASQYLASHSFDVRPILSPTVPKNRECLRLTLHSYNTITEVHRCLDLIDKWRKK
jgi:8-amino-7-oxononanoate synthase